MLSQVKGLIQLIVMFRLENNLCTFISSTKHPLEIHKILRTKTILQQYSEKERIESLHFPEGKQFGAFLKNS